MTDHDRARRSYRIACALAEVRWRENGARPWFARVSGYNPIHARTWGEDGWPTKARAVLDTMDMVHPVQWPRDWLV